MPERGNRLSHEKSPYLLQHADNPVDWYPWGDDAFERARREDRPVFLSVGYSTCHWCHVMAHESFEDDRVASLLNESFVCVKVDREERPDIDGVYMDAAVLMTGRGGWPLTIVMTPDGRPFFAATYLPRESRFGLPGLVELLPRIAELWRDHRAEVLETAGRVEAALKGGGRSAPLWGAKDDAGESLSETAVIEAAVHELSARFDGEHGGFGDAPKFPSPHNLVFLLRRWWRTGDAKLLRMVEATLDAMRRGGIYDQVGFGFHRYSTDERWLVPHFEKMLYDQATLAAAYAEASTATGNVAYARTAREIIEYVLRDMTSPEGLFYSAEDADSEGVEGRFYVWTTKELRDALKRDDAELAIDVFGATDQGNATDALGGTGGLNILHLPRPLNLVAEERGVPEVELRTRLDGIRSALLARREARVRPHRDDKILTDWNALMISALAVAGRHLADPSCVDAANGAADRMLATVRSRDGRLLHTLRSERAGVAATANDYAFLVAALLDLHAATLDTKRLSEAIRLNAEFVDAFWDEEESGFHFTAADAERLLVRRKELFDGALPSANSVALSNLVRLSRLTGDASLELLASRLADAALPQAAAIPSAHTMFLSALDLARAPSREVVIAGESGADDTRDLLRAARDRYDPGLVLLLRHSGNAAELSGLAPWTDSMVPVGGRAAAYVCVDRTCGLPTTDAERMLDLLEQP